MKSKSARPLGISILAILHIIVGPLTIVAPIPAIHSMPMAERVCIGIFELCLGFGLFQLRQWALPATISFYGLAMIGSIQHPHLHVSTIALAAVVVAYLCTPGARRAFLPRSLPTAPASLPNS